MLNRTFSLPRGVGVVRSGNWFVLTSDRLTDRETLAARVISAYKARVERQRFVVLREVDIDIASYDMEEAPRAGTHEAEPPTPLHVV